MQNTNSTKVRPLILENYKFFSKIYAAFFYIPNALRAIDNKTAFPPFTFHISGSNGNFFGLSEGQICYPTVDSASYDQLKLMIIKLEDKRFFYHSGIDLPGIIRALFYNFLHRRIVQGASTITQQLVRNVLLSPDRSMTRKLTEAILAKKIEDRKSTRLNSSHLRLSRMPSSA